MIKPRYRVKARRGFLSVDGGLLIGEDAPNVQTWQGVTKLDLPADRVLRAAVGVLKDVVIVGFDKNGAEYFASSVADGGDALWHLERAKTKLLR